MDGQITPIGERPIVQPPGRDRRARDDGRKGFHRELDRANGEEEEELRDAIVVPRPRATDTPVAPPDKDEAGLRVDVEA